MKEADKYKEVDWNKELDEYFAKGDYPIKAFVRGKEYSYYAFKDRLYRDPRYQGRNSRWHRYDSETELKFLQVVISEERSTDIRINGFTITISEHTDETALKKLLTVMRDM